MDELETASEITNYQYSDFLSRTGRRDCRNMPQADCL